MNKCDKLLLEALKASLQNKKVNWDFAFVFHYHNQFDVNYQKYRVDVDGDREYIAKKMKR